MAATAFLEAFAKAQLRLLRLSPITEREIHDHRYGERPVGDGWTLIEVDPHGYATWERTRLIKAADEIPSLDHA